MSRLLKVASVSSATLALIAGTAMTSAFAAEETPAATETTPAAAETTPAAGNASDLIPVEGTKITIGDGIIFFIADTPTLNADGSNTGLATVPTSAFDGSFVVAENADSIKVGDTINTQLDYTYAAGNAQIKAVWDGYADASMLGVWSSSDSNVVSVENGIDLKAVGEGSATLTYTPVSVKDGVVVAPERTFTVLVKVNAAAAATPTPVETTPAPVETTPAPVETTPAAEPTDAAVPEAAPTAEATTEATPTEAPVAEAPVAEATTETVLTEAVTADPAALPFVYENCAAVYAAGAAPIYDGQYGWDASLDADNDGVGCEDTPDYVNSSYVSQSTASQSVLANTGAAATVPFVAGLTLLGLGTGAVVYSRRRTN